MWLSQSCTDLHRCGLWAQHYQPTRKVGSTDTIVGSLLWGQPTTSCVDWMTTPQEGILAWYWRPDQKSVTREAASLNEAVTAVVLVIGMMCPSTCLLETVFMSIDLCCCQLCSEKLLWSVSGVTAETPKWSKWQYKWLLKVQPKWDISITLWF